MGKFFGINRIVTDFKKPRTFIIPVHYYEVLKMKKLLTPATTSRLLIGDLHKRKPP